MTTAEKEVLRAAKAWWRGRRPVTYDAQDHMDNPMVNTVHAEEQRLAQAVAKLVCGRRKNETPGHR